MNGTEQDRPMRGANGPLSVLLGLAMIAMASCGEGPSSSENDPVDVRDGNGLHVILLTIDTTRADRLGCYGYELDTSPAMDALAERGVTFDNAYTCVPLTLPAHASLFSGNYPFWHQVRDNYLVPLSPSVPTLAERLLEEGYDTTAIISASVLGAQFGLDQGFENYVDLTENGASLIAPADQVTGEAIKRLEASDPKTPQLFWLHYFDPHLPYNPPDPFASKFDHPYDGEIAFMDAEIGRFLEAVDRHLGRDNTLVALIADHGEDLEEHIEKDHGKFIYNTTMRVPYLLAGPGVPQSKRVEETVRIIDVLPTLTTLLDLEPWESIQGVDWTPYLQGEEEVPEVDAYLETYHTHLSFGWAWLEGICTSDGGTKFIDAPRPETYELSRDPGETKNVYGSDERRDRALRARIQDIKRLAPPRPSEREGVIQRDADTFKDIQELGYTAGDVEILEDRGPDPKDVYHYLDTYQQARRFAHAGQLRRSVQLFDEFIASCPRKGKVQEAIGYVFHRAATRRPSGDRVRYRKQAIAYLERAVTEAPPTTEALYTLASLWRTLPEGEDKYVEFLERVLDVNPEHDGALFFLGTHHFAKDEPRKAAPYLRRFVKAYPEDRDRGFWAYYRLCLSDLSLDEIDLADGSARKVHEFDARQPHGAWCMGQVAEHRGALEDARSWYRECLQKARRAQKPLRELQIEEVEARLRALGS